MQWIQLKKYIYRYLSIYIYIYIYLFVFVQTELHFRSRNTWIESPWLNYTNQRCFNPQFVPDARVLGIIFLWRSFFRLMKCNVLASSATYLVHSATRRVFESPAAVSHVVCAASAFNCFVLVRPYGVIHSMFFVRVARSRERGNGLRTLFPIFAQSTSNLQDYKRSHTLCWAHVWVKNGAYGRKCDCVRKAKDTELEWGQKFQSGAFLSCVMRSAAEQSNGFLLQDVSFLVGE